MLVPEILTKRLRSSNVPQPNLILAWFYLPKRQIDVYRLALSQKYKPCELQDVEFHCYFISTVVRTTDEKSAMIKVYANFTALYRLKLVIYLRRT